MKSIEKLETAIALRNDGKTYREIACRLSVTPQRARQLCSRAKRWGIFPGAAPYWWEGLGAREITVLLVRGCKSKNDVRALLAQCPNGTDLDLSKDGRRRVLKWAAV